MAVEKWQVDASLRTSLRVAIWIFMEASTFFSKGCPPQVAFPSWRDGVRLRRLVYILKEYSVVLPLKIWVLLPGLPDACIGASLSGVDFAGEEVREGLLNPLLLVKPESGWPVDLVKASRQGACEKAWLVLRVHLWTCGMAKVFAESQVFTVIRQGVMSFFLAIQVNEVPGEGPTRVTLLISALPQ